MKSKLSVLLAAFIVAPLVLACPCDKKKDNDKDKKDGTTLAHCGKCEGDKDKDKDKAKKEDGTLAECGKCKGDKDKDKDKKEDGTLA